MALEDDIEFLIPLPLPPDCWVDKPPTTTCVSWGAADGVLNACCVHSLPTEPHSRLLLSLAKHHNIFISLTISYMYTMHFDNIRPTLPSQFLAIIFAASLSPLDFCTSDESGSSLSTTLFHARCLGAVLLVRGIFSLKSTTMRLSISLWMVNRDGSSLELP